VPPKAADNFGQFVPVIRLSPPGVNAQYVELVMAADRESRREPCATWKLT
jgi:hypothetical protein